MKKVLSIISILLCLTLLCGCETWNNFKKAFLSPKLENQKLIKIGILEPTTGRQSYDAEDELKGMEFAHSLFPSVYGYQIELVYQDNRSNTDIAKEAALSLINDGCSIILGSYSDTLSLASSDVIKENCTPAIAASCTIPILTQTNPYYFRVSSINTFDAQCVAKYLNENANVYKCAVLIPQNDDYASNKAALFEEKFITLCGSNVFSCTYTQIDSETEEEITITTEEPTVYYIEIDGAETSEEINEVLYNLDLKGYEYIYCPCDSTLALPWISKANEYVFIEEQKKLDKENEEAAKEDTEEPEEEPEEEPDYFFTFIGTDKWVDIEKTMDSEKYDLSILNHVQFTKDYDVDSALNDMSELFYSKYQSKFGSDSKPSDNFALGFDAYYLAYNALLSNIKSALKEADITEEEFSNDAGLKDVIENIIFDENGNCFKDRITNEILSTRNLVCVTGTISIDAFGDPAKDTLIEGYSEYGFIVIDSISPDSISQ